MNTLRQIVDEEDNVIAYKPNDEIDYSKEIYRVAALWLGDSRGNILLAQRSLQGNNGAGQWGPAVAGTVEQDETYESNIYKEAEEEIGLTGLRFEIGPKVRFTGSRNYFVQWYKGTIERKAEEFTLQDDEVEAVRWVSSANLINDIQDNQTHYIEGFEYAVTLLAGREAV